MTEVPPLASPTELRPVLEELIRFVDITGDLERNRDDAVFAKNDGTICYVFDENVFEMFVLPSRWKSRTVTFYSTFGQRRAKLQDRKEWTEIAAQSALLAAEFLLSGALPGQKDGKLFLTEWHFWELRDRLDTLLDEQRRLLDSMTAPKVTTSNPSVESQSSLNTDIGILERQEGWTREAIDRFIVTRRTANILATDKVLEPIEQIGRLTQGPIRDRFATLTDAFEIPRTEFNAIAANARSWLERLLTEQKRLKRRTFPRHPGALVNDARSLALVQWTAKRCVGTNRRVVFVTGDTLVFDAYRRWYVSIASDSDEYMQPFALRRVVQYAPIFNMNDAIGDIYNAGQLFNLTRQAIEVALLPFNLSQMGGRGERRDVVTRGREFLALKLTDATDVLEDPEIRFFAKHFTRTWLEDSRQRLSDVQQLWQRTERAAIGSMYETILPRLGRAQRVLAEELAEPGAADIGPALARYVDSLLSRIVRDSFRLWLPLASSFIDSELRAKVSDIQSRRSRWQILVRLDVSWNGSVIDLSTWLESWARGEQAIEQMFSLEREPSIVNRPDLVFGIASTLALTLGDWSNAERFAELAKQSSLMEGQNRPQGERYEFVYLHAVAKRFRIGDLGPASNDGAYVILSKLRGDAVAMLALCIAHHHGSDGDVSLQPLREIRARTERASVNLFFVAAATLTTNPSLRNRILEENDVGSALIAAEQDLLASVALERIVEVETPLSEVRSRIFSRLQRQIVSNVATFIVVQKVLLNRDSSDVLTSRSLAERAAILLEQEEDNLSEVVRSDLLLFIYISGFELNLDEVIVPRLRKRRRIFTSLFLDQARLKANNVWIESEVGRLYDQGQRD